MAKERQKKYLKCCCFSWKNKVMLWNSNILPSYQNTEEKFHPINLSGHKFYVSVNFNWYHILDKMIQSKVFRKQFQSSLINMLKWFRSDGRTKQKDGKIQKPFSHSTHISIKGFFYLKYERESKEKRMELLLKIYSFNMFALYIL